MNCLLSRASLIDRAACTVADVVQGDGIAFDGKQDAKDAGAAAVEHLMQGDAELLGFVVGDGVPLGKGGQLGNGFLDARVPVGGGDRRSINQVAELFDKIGSGPAGENDAVGQWLFFSARMFRISASTSAAGITLPACMSLMDACNASIRSARSASSISF